MIYKGEEYDNPVYVAMKIDEEVQENQKYTDYKKKYEKEEKFVAGKSSKASMIFAIIGIVIIVLSLIAQIGGTIGYTWTDTLSYSQFKDVMNVVFIIIFVGGKLLDYVSILAEILAIVFGSIGKRNDGPNGVQKFGKITGIVLLSIVLGLKTLKLLASFLAIFIFCVILLLIVILI